MVQLGQTGGAEPLRQLALDDDILDLVSEQLVVDVAGHGRLVHGERLHGRLHPGNGRECHRKNVRMFTFQTQGCDWIMRKKPELL